MFYRTVQFFGNSLKNDAKFMMKCMNYNELASFFISSELKNNYEFLIESININKYMLDHVIELMNNEKEFAKYAIERIPELKQYWMYAEY